MKRHLQLHDICYGIQWSIPREFSIFVELYHRVDAFQFKWTNSRFTYDLNTQYDWDKYPNQIVIRRHPAAVSKAKIIKKKSTKFKNDI